MCGGSAIHWFSRMQKYSTLSTFDAENVAMRDAVNETMFMRYVW